MALCASFMSHVEYTLALKKQSVGQMQPCLPRLLWDTELWL